MSNVVSMREQALDPAVIESIVIKGDLSGLNQTQKVAYYNFRCQQAGLRSRRQAIRSTHT
jgi:hypothetical protein